MGTVKYSGPIASFHCPTEATIRSLKVHFSPKQEGSGDPSPENVRPIVGWDGVEVYSRNQNLIASEAEWLSDKWIIDNGKLRHSVYYSFYIPVPKGTFYIHKNKTGSLAYGGLIDRPPEVGDTAYESITLTSYLNRTVNNEDGHPYLLICGPTSEPNKSLKEWLIENEVWIDLINPSSFMKPYHGSTTNYEFGVLGKNKLSDDISDYNFLAASQSAYSYTLNNGEFSATVPSGVRDYLVILGKIQYAPGTYTLSFDYVNGGGNTSWQPVLVQYTSSWYSSKVAFYANQSEGHYERTFTSDVPFSINLCLNSFGNTTQEGLNKIYNLQLELGSSATTYEPYDPNHTVYGGWVDLISGEVVKTWTARPISQMTVVKTNGSGVWQHRFDLRAPWITGVGYEDAGGAYQAICSIFSFGTAETNFTYRTYAGLIDVYDDTTETAEDFKTKYGNYTVAYNIRSELYEYYQLAPMQLQTFLAQNNIWSNADYVEVEYDLHEMQNILARKQFIIANQPHVVKLAAAPLQSFTTDMAAALKECKVGFKPVQDLHGYDKPWVGGSGKNLFNENNMTYGLWTSGNGTVDNLASYGCMVNDKIFIAANTVLYLTVFGDELYSKAMIFYNTDGTFNSRAYSTGTTQLTYTPAIDCYVTVELANGTSTSASITEEYVKAAKVVLSVGSTATVYEPWENVCPIEGWTELEVTRCGKNFSTAATGTEMAQKWPIISSGSSRTLELSGLEPGQEFTLSASFTKASEPSTNKRLYLIGSQKANSASNTIFYGPAADGSRDVTIHNWVDTDGTIRIQHNNRGLTYNDDFIEYAASLQNIQLEVGETATAFEPYNGTTIPITFPSEAGTIYGGYVDLVTGEVWETWAESDLSMWSWAQVNTNRIRSYSVTDMEIPQSTGTYGKFIGEQVYSATQSQNLTNYPNGIAIMQAGYWYKYFDGINYPKGKICYKLATPRLLATLTPTQLKSLRGTNNVWSNANGNIELSYWKH